nr:Ferredoxin domain containing protein [Haemonchus contortus]
MYVAKRIVRILTVSQAQWSFPLKNQIPKRLLSLTASKFHGDYEYQDPKSEDEVVNVTYVLRDGTKKHVRGKVGDNVMYLAHRYDIEMEGACEASLACSTCHCYVADPYFDRLTEPKEEEEDMLDQAPALRPNSRLGCQIILRKDLDGIVLTLPPITRNFYVDGHVPQPH